MRSRSLSSYVCATQSVCLVAILAYVCRSLSSLKPVQYNKSSPNACSPSALPLLGFATPPHKSWQCFFVQSDLDTSLPYVVGRLAWAEGSEHFAGSLQLGLLGSDRMHTSCMVVSCSLFGERLPQPPLVVISGQSNRCACLQAGSPCLLAEESLANSRLLLQPPRSLWVG